MKFSEVIKPIRYLEAHTSEVIRDVCENRKTMIITHKGEAKVILQDVTVFEQNQESLALLKVLALSGKEIRHGNTKPIEVSFKKIRECIAGFKHEPKRNSKYR